jgi:hypothetical protein
VLDWHDQNEAARKPVQQQGVQWIDLSGLIDGEWYQWDNDRGYYVPCLVEGSYLITGPNDDE